jgi:deoxyribonuclease IV
VYLGAHLGIADGLAEASHEAKRIGAEAIQIFSKSPHLWAGPPLAEEAARSFREAVRADGLRATAVHHGYLANLASPKAPGLARSRRAFLDEVRRAEMLGVDALIFHPGAHLGAGAEEGLDRIAESLRTTVAAVPEGKVRLLLENAAGQGTTLGSTFGELARVLARADLPDRLGVALDTCHLLAAGHEFRTEETYGRFADELEATVGRSAVRAFHLNDAKAPLGSHLDRHENIGRGQIGRDGFRPLLLDPRWAEVPGYLETPLDDHGYDRYAEDLRTLKSIRERGPAERGAVRAASRAPARRRASTVK